MAITPDDADLEDLFEDLKARVFAHNIDSDFYCCNNVTF